MSTNFHEPLERPKSPLPSDRSTGLLFAALALLIAYVWWTNMLALWLGFGTATALITCSLPASSLIRPLNVAWMRLALLLSKIMIPTIMLLLFAIAIGPTGLVIQLVRDPLRSRRQPGAIATGSSD